MELQKNSTFYANWNFQEFLTEKWEYPCPLRQEYCRYIGTITFLWNLLTELPILRLTGSSLFRRSEMATNRSPVFDNFLTISSMAFFSKSLIRENYRTEQFAKIIIMLGYILTTEQRLKHLNQPLPFPSVTDCVMHFFGSPSWRQQEVKNLKPVMSLYPCHKL